MKRYLLVSVLTLLLLSTATVTCSAVEYRVRDLGWLGTGYTEIVAVAISDSGMIIGHGVSSQDNNTYSAVWDWDGNITALERLGIRSGASDINSSGTIVGYVEMSNNNPYASIWNASGVITRTVGPGSANAINDFGQILLYDNTGYLILNPDDTSYRLSDMPGYRYSVASGLNSNGWAAGNTMDMDYRYHPTVWDNEGNGSIMSMPSGSTYSEVYAINDTNKVAGYATDYVWTSAVVWSPGGAPSLLPNLAGYEGSIARDINNAGWAVGSSFSVLSQPVIWDDNGNVSALPLLQGGSYGAAWAINNHGLIVGYSDDESGSMRAVLWEPIPEPSSLLALGTGVLGLLGLRLRRRSVGP